MPPVSTQRSSNPEHRPYSNDAARERSVFVRRAMVSVALVTVVALSIWFLWYTVDILLLAFAGVLMGVLLRSLSGWLSDHSPLSNGWALTIVSVLLVGAFGVAGWLLTPSLLTQFTELSQTLPNALQQLEARVAAYPWGQGLIDQMTSQVQPDGSEVLNRAAGIFSTTLGALSSFAIVLCIGFYLAAEPRVYSSGILHLVPHSKRQRAGEVLGALGYTLRWWLLGRLCSMTVVGTLTALGLWLLGTPLALTLGLLAALLDFVPNIGPLIAAVPALLLALMNDPTQALYVAALYIVVQTFEGYLLTPLVERQTVLLPPALTLLAQAILAVLTGGLGLVLAAPLTASALVLIKMLYVEDVIGDDLDVPGEDQAPVTLT